MQIQLYIVAEGKSHRKETCCFKVLTHLKFEIYEIHCSQQFLKLHKLLHKYFSFQTKVKIQTNQILTLSSFLTILNFEAYEKKEFCENLSTFHESGSIIDVKAKVISNQDETCKQ